jgi:hypothetical protein
MAYASQQSETGARGENHASDGTAAGAKELTGQLSEDLSRIVRDEVRLAAREWQQDKQELSRRGKLAGLGAGLGGTAGVLSLFGIGALTAGFILLLNIVLPGWAAALIIAGVWFAVAAILGISGAQGMRKGIKGASEMSQAATGRMKEDFEAVKGARK